LLKRRALIEHGGKARLQDKIEFSIRNEAYSSPKCSLVRRTVSFLQGAFIIVLALRERDGKVEIEIIVDERVIVVCEILVFDNRRYAKIRLPAPEAR
jgi:hypothetical protein